MINGVNRISFSGRKDSDNNIKASIIASTISSGTQTVCALPAVGIINLMVKPSKRLTQDEIKIVNDAGEQMVKDFKLDEKGVKINNLSGLVNKTKIPDWLGRIIDPIYGTSEGYNAFFTNKDIKKFGFVKNNIYINKSKLPLAQFHEIGHAINYNTSKVLGSIQKMRLPLMVTSGLIALFAAFTTNTTGAENSNGEKFKNFIRNNAGKLSVLAMLPIVAEEFKASLNAQKWVNKNLSKDLAKKVGKTNLIGAASYILTALAMGIGSSLTVKYKDKKVDEKKIQEAEKKLSQEVKEAE